MLIGLLSQNIFIKSQIFYSYIVLISVGAFTDFKGGEKVEDDLIIRYIKSKKEKGITLLIDNYGALIKSIVRKYIGDLGNGYDEECISDIIFSIWNNINSFNKEKNNFKNWIAAISKYKALDYKKKYYKVSLNENIDKVSISSEENLDENIIRDDLNKEIRTLLESLNKSDRELFIRYYLEEESLDNISNDLSVGRSTLYNRLSRGRKKLKNSFSNIFQGDFMKRDFSVFNDIKVDLEEFEEEELSELEKKRMVKKVLKKINVKRNKKKTISVMIAFIAMTSVFIFSNKGVYAEILSKVERYFNKNNEELEPYRKDNNIVIKSSKSSGIKVNVSDVILDDIYLLAKIEIDPIDLDLTQYGLSNEDKNRISVGTQGEVEMYLDDKLISKKRTIYDTEKGDSGISEFIRVEYNPEDLDLSKKSKLKFLINNIYLTIYNEKNNMYEKNYKIIGDWKFEVDVEGKELQKGLKVFNINKKQKFENEFYKGTIEVKEFRESPISKKIILRKTEGKGNNPYYDLVTEFYDENNTKIEYNWIAENDERTILEIKDNKDYKKIKVINKVVERDGNMNVKKVIDELEPIIINLN